jgi:hypothetical protein
LRKEHALEAKNAGTDVMIRCLGPRNTFKQGKIVDLMKKLKGGSILSYAKIQWSTPCNEQEFSVVAISRIISSDQMLGRAV